MIHESAHASFLGAFARHMLFIPYIEATEEDMVRVAHTDGFHTHIDSVCFQAPAFPGVEEKGNVRDLAFASALSFYEVDWNHTVPLNRVHHALIAYTDMHGTWCTECGNSVYTGENGGYVCANPSCCNYDSDNCPVWAKELHNVA